MRIAICEDDDKQARLVSQYVGQHPGVASHEVFSSADGLLAACGSGERFDLIFMDIRMEGKDGFQAAKELVRDCGRDCPRIVFLTVSQDYAPYGYGIAWRFIVKPAGMETIHGTIDEAAAEMERRTVAIETTAGTASIDVNDIIYITSNYGMVQIYTTRGEHATRQTLAAVAALLPQRLIVQAHRSYYVNLVHVTGYKGGVVFLSNKAKVPIGRDKRDGFIAALAVHLRGEKGGRLQYLPSV